MYDLIDKLTWITNEGKNMLVGNLSNVWNKTITVSSIKEGFTIFHHEEGENKMNF